MKLTVVALGHKMPAWVQAGFEEYAKRMPPESRIDLIELKPEDRSSRMVAKVLEQEGKRIDAAVPRQAERVVLDERGIPLTTAMLAAWMKAWMADGISPCFIIGSADGLAPEVKQSAKRLVALSGCTLPHGMVRVLLAEQLYRAWTLLQNHPYHRE
ncbi:MAG: 23S rRNA (pseudouridine(1915)-N(3))-methyltransferase RlmH [Betaproteobacteria bacterium]|nr:23S rRNA (pseudouridine(1915)-N(3))-methyltransferase RlmH [Betaproteobacteria bacterium]